MTHADLSARAGCTPLECQPWCRDGDGHPHERAREDQWCLGIEFRVPLSTEPTEFLSDGTIQQPYLNTYLLRQADDTAPRVFIGHGGRSGKSATLAEARKFALEILTLVDSQRGNTK
jgi:Domain of unknown function (DUF6907)